jgi:hypothetical protein
MSFTPYDWEDEERRDSERFADPSVYDDEPDPSEYIDCPTGRFEWEDELVKMQHGAGILDPADDVHFLRGCLTLLFGILGAIMFWVWLGTTVARWLS